MDDAPENGVSAAALAGDDDEVVGDIDEHEVGHCTAVSRFFPTPCPPKLTKVLTTAGYSIRYRHMFQISFRRRIGPIGGSAEGLRSLDDLLTLLKHLPPTTPRLYYFDCHPSSSRPSLFNGKVYTEVTRRDYHHHHCLLLSLFFFFSFVVCIFVSLRYRAGENITLHAHAHIYREENGLSFFSSSTNDHQSQGGTERER